jgi:hypothetical protein
MTLKVFGAIVFCAVFAFGFAIDTLAQTNRSPIAQPPYTYSEAPQRAPSFPATAPREASQMAGSIVHGYSAEQLENLQSDPSVKIHANGVVEHLSPSREERMAGAKRNLPNAPGMPSQPPAGWNSSGLVGVDPGSAATPSVGDGTVPAPHPIESN